MKAELISCDLAHAFRAITSGGMRSSAGIGVV